MVKNKKQIILVLLLLACSVWAQVDESQLGLLNSEASGFFREANGLLKSDRTAAYDLYDKSILRYEKMIEVGDVENVYLYYNIGNAYLMKQDMGRAILNYRRGERLDSGFADLLKNLSYARMQRKDRIVATTEKKILQTLFFWHYDLDDQGKFVLVTGLWIGFCLLLALSLWRRKFRGLRLVLFLLALAVLSLSISLAIDVLGEARDLGGVILENSVVARQGDGENYPPSFEQPLHSGTEFTLLEDRSDWLHIELANGHNAWIRRSAVGLVE